MSKTWVNAKRFKAFMEEFNKKPIPLTPLRQEMLKNLEEMLESGKIFFPYAPKQHGRKQFIDLFGRKVKA